MGNFRTELEFPGMSMHVSFEVPNFSECACSEVTVVLQSKDYRNRPYLYSQLWTGTSLQWRLMWGNVLKSICI